MRVKFTRAKGEDSLVFLRAAYDVALIQEEEIEQERIKKHTEAKKKAEEMQAADHKKAVKEWELKVANAWWWQNLPERPKKRTTDWRHDFPRWLHFGSKKSEDIKTLIKLFETDGEVILSDDQALTLRNAMGD